MLYMATYELMALESESIPIFLKNFSPLAVLKGLTKPTQAGNQFCPPIALTTLTLISANHNRTVGNTGLFIGKWRNNFTYN